MAKKKPARTASKGPADAAVDEAAEQAAAQQQQAQGNPKSSSPTEESADLPTGVPELQDKVKQLSSELTETREQLKRLEAALAQKDDELVAMRQAKASGPKPDAFKHQDVGKLQERLGQLRKEQAEADAARDAAWKQLKSVVSNISKLASPDYLASINIPS